MERPPRRPNRETPVVPLHAHRPPAQPPRSVGGLALADPAVGPPPEGPARRTESIDAVKGARARRASADRPAHDGWTFVIVPPGVNARPRTLHLSTRRFRFATASIATLVGTGLVCAGLLALMLNVAPAIQDESAGVELGLFDEFAGVVAATPVTEPDLLSLLAIGPAAATVANPTAAEVASKKAERPVGPRTDVARAKAERRRVLAAPSMSGEREPAWSAMASAEGLPVLGRITSRFSSSRRHPVLGVVRPHRGVDIAAASGTPIHAPAAGRVIFSGRKFGFGNVVEIDHGHGIVTRYAHCRTLRVKRGARVTAGTMIATVGRTGLASGPHLHFELLLDGKSVDPLKQRVQDVLATRAGPPPLNASPVNLFVPGMPAAVVPAAPESAPDSAAATRGDEQAAGSGEQAGSGEAQAKGG